MVLLPGAEGESMCDRKLAAATTGPGSCSGGKQRGPAGAPRLPKRRTRKLQAASTGCGRSLARPAARLHALKRTMHKPKADVRLGLTVGAIRATLASCLGQAACVSRTRSPVQMISVPHSYRIDKGPRTCTDGRHFQPVARIATQGWPAAQRPSTQPCSNVAAGCRKLRYAGTRASAGQEPAATFVR